MKTSTALLIVDIQNDYFKGGANPLVGSNEAARVAGKVLDIFRSKDLPVIHIQHHAVRPGSTFFIPGTQGAEIHPFVSPKPGEKVFTKNYPNSFRNTGLLDYLNENHIQQLVICGMMTHMCIDATTRAAKDLDFNCYVISDACATKNLEFNGISIPADHVHAAFLSALNYYYANVISSGELSSLLE
jgi:nicotinamidase-related amidase